MSQENLAILGEICSDGLQKAQQLMENNIGTIMQYPVLPIK